MPGRESFPRAVPARPPDRAPPPPVKDFRRFSPAALHALFADVYSSSDTMSEALEDKYPDARSLAENMAALEKLPGAVALAAEVDGKPAAYAVIRPRKQARLRHTADLGMGVARDARGRGLGETVLRAALDRIRDESVIEIVYLMVRADNAPALRLYEKTGFETVAVLDRDTKIGDVYFAGVLMRRHMRA
ncbi:MAG: GNAT family N-acetyltransferase [Candidatus Accumulibacter sp.]|jgi:ribosomal protein S18 acetylase RimI-like enzyme|nr:GNAT family N-acetyltransferase [Accumulibacter sp.]